MSGKANVVVRIGLLTALVSSQVFPASGQGRGTALFRLVAEAADRGA
jgi:hypothetical protein